MHHKTQKNDFKIMVSNKQSYAMFFGVVCMFT